MTLAMAQQTKSAISLFTALAVDYPEHPELANNLGVLYAREGNDRAAARWLTIAANSRSPYGSESTHTIASRNLGEVDTALAATTYIQALNDPSRHALKGWAARLTLVSHLQTKAAIKSPATGRVQVGGSGQGGLSPNRPPTEVGNRSTVRHGHRRGMTQEQRRAKVIAAVNAWAHAWSRQDVDAYLNAYARNFNPPHGQTLAAWKALRRKRVRTPLHISLKLSSLQVVFENNGHALVKFYQRYRSNDYADKTWKTLVLEDTDGKWRIIREIDRRHAPRRVKPLRSVHKPVLRKSASKTQNSKPDETWLNDGYSALNRGDKASALQFFERAGQADPNDPEAWKNIAYLKLDKGDKSGALDAFKRASRLAPKDAEVWKNIGYLDIDNGNKAGALHAFQQARDLKPNDAEIWTNLGYLENDQGHKAEALSDFQHARRLKPNSAEINMEIAYLQSGLGHPDKARASFGAAARSTSNPKLVQEACSGERNAAFASTKLLPDPYFGDVYFAPYYDNTRSRDSIFPFKARLGRHFGKDNRGSVYGFLSAQDDTQSTGGRQPNILNDNAAILGVGADYRPIDSWPVTVYAEAGYGYDLTYRDRSRGRFGYTVGVTGYQAWGLPAPTCGNQTHWLWKPYVDLYGDLEYDSRQDNDLLFQLRPRFGLTVADGPWGSARTYLKANLLAGAKGFYYNNLFEFGPGIAWQLPTTIPIVLRAEYLWGAYLINANQSPNGKTYHGPRVEMDLYWAF